MSEDEEGSSEDSEESNWSAEEEDDGETGKGVNQEMGGNPEGDRGGTGVTAGTRVLVAGSSVFVG